MVKRIIKKLKNTYKGNKTGKGLCFIIARRRIKFAAAFYRPYKYTLYSAHCFYFSMLSIVNSTIPPGVNAETFSPTE